MIKRNSKICQHRTHHGSICGPSLRESPRIAVVRIQQPASSLFASWRQAATQPSAIESIIALSVGVFPPTNVPLTDCTNLYDQRQRLIGSQKHTYDTQITKILSCVFILLHLCQTQIPSPCLPVALPFARLGECLQFPGESQTHRALLMCQQHSTTAHRTNPNRILQQCGPK